MKVLKGWDSSKLRPWIMVIEATKPNSKSISFQNWEAFLINAKYHFVYFDGLNRFYVSDEHFELDSFFSTPLNVFDVFENNVQLTKNSDFCRNLSDDADSVLQSQNTCISKIKSDFEHQQQVLQQAISEEKRHTLHANTQVTLANESILELNQLLFEEKEKTLLASARATLAEESILKLNYLMIDLISKEKASAANALNKMSQAKNSLIQLQKVHSGLISSKSWRITQPLRSLNAKLSAGSHKNARKFLKKLHHNILKLKALLDKQEAHTRNMQHEFMKFSFPQFTLFFSLAPLEDNRGIGRVTRELLNFLSSQNLEEPPKKILFLDSEIQNNDTDIFFYSTIHWCPNKLSKKSIVMIHDVIPLVLPELFPAASLEWSKKFKAIAAQASRVVTISQTSSNDIAQHLGIDITKIDVIYNGVTALTTNNHFDVSTLPKTPYVVYLGSHDKHKNLDVILEAMADPITSDTHLCLIGSNKECESIVKCLKIEGKVSFLGRLTDGDASYVIKNAVALVFPSLYEGFGLPPMEAALLGTPSICSNVHAMDELLKDAALFASPNNPKEWAQAIVSLRENQNLHDSISEKAYKAVQNFTWEKTGNLLFDIFAQQKDKA